MGYVAIYSSIESGTKVEIVDDTRLDEILGDANNHTIVSREIQPTDTIASLEGLVTLMNPANALHVSLLVDFFNGSPTEIILLNEWVA